jgi:hypothetical protein
MKRNTFLAIALLLSFNLLAQQQLENAGFETWQNAGSPTEEPTEWSSIKTSDATTLNALAPQVCELSTDAHSGTYSVKLTNVSTTFGPVATGTLTNGRAHADVNANNGYVFTDASNAQWNTTMTTRPDSIVGWYKYAPNNGDKCKVEAILHTGAAKNPENGTAANFIGRARFLSTANVGTWTRFSVPFSYYNSNTPSHILVVLTAGDSTIAKSGSIAFYDDLELIYNPVSVEEINASNVSVFDNGSFIQIQIPENNSKSVVVKVFDLQGRVVNNKSNLSKGINYIEKPNVDGVYLVNLSFDGKMITKKVVISK